MPDVRIRSLAGAEEAAACARMMSRSEPWLTIGRGYDACLPALTDPTREVYVAVQDGRILGFIVLLLSGAFVGYIQTVCVVPDARGTGLGTQLLQFAEQRISEVSPNVFLCVSSFNPKARALYERLGYQLVGELTDYLIRGHSELLYRKTTGPLMEFTAPAAETLPPPRARQ